MRKQGIPAGGFFAPGFVGAPPFKEEPQRLPVRELGELQRESESESESKIFIPPESESESESEIFLYFFDSFEDENSEIDVTMKI